MEILCETEAVAIKSQTLTGSRNVPRKLACTLPKNYKKFIKLNLYLMEGNSTDLGRLKKKRLQKIN